ncbi:hypothetical protein, partial [Spirabiliibacterium mucosae]|uniref:hypothetical protein n=1 Tax=Spirabiliibacterium mucosae TaxID=28156 RepID=UPI001AACF465
PDFFARPKKSGKERALPFLRKSRLLGISTSHLMQALKCFLEIHPTAPFPREKWRDRTPSLRVLNIKVRSLRSQNRIFKSCLTALLVFQK